MEVLSSASTAYNHTAAKSADPSISVSMGNASLIASTVSAAGSSICLPKYVRSTVTEMGDRYLMTRNRNHEKRKCIYLSSIFQTLKQNNQQSVVAMENAARKAEYAAKMGRINASWARGHAAGTLVSVMGARASRVGAIESAATAVGIAASIAAANEAYGFIGDVKCELGRLSNQCKKRRCEGGGGGMSHN